MRVIAKRTLRNFWDEHASARGALEAWHAEALKAAWKTPNELKEQFGSASVLGNNRVVFNISGNNYRLIVSIDYERQAMFLKFIGTHAEYDKIDAENYDAYRSR
ncbi:MAG: type II toxin-antitoxin system HigB family toxin [bacterium]|nr:type II toxin-antitoxin system HigB family toxin [bacterium]